jgi:hypothetical protein
MPGAAVTAMGVPADSWPASTARTSPSDPNGDVAGHNQPPLGPGVLGVDCGALPARSWSLVRNHLAGPGRLGGEPGREHLPAAAELAAARPNPLCQTPVRHEDEVNLCDQ